MNKNLSFIIVLLICILLSGCTSNENFIGEWSDFKDNYIIIYSDEKAFIYISIKDKKYIDVVNYSFINEKIYFKINPNEIISTELFGTYNENKLTLNFNSIELLKNQNPLYKNHDYSISPHDYSDLILNGIDVEKALHK